MFERGQIVRPKAVTIANTGYKKSSRLVIRIQSTRYPRICVGCRGRLRKQGRRRVLEEATLLEPGELYAAGQEAGCPLCLNCVEPVPGE